MRQPVARRPARATADSAEEVARRVGARPDPLRRARNSSSRSWCPDGAHSLSRRRAPPPSTPCSPSPSGRGAGPAGGAGGRGDRQLLDRVHDLRRRPGARRARPRRLTGSRLGAIAIGYPAERAGPREPAPTDGLLVTQMSLHASVVAHAERLAGTRSRPGRAAPRGAGLRAARPDALPARRASRATSPASALRARPRRHPRRCSPLHPRVGRWLQLGGHCEESDADIAAAALREATEESGHRRPDASSRALAALHVHPLTLLAGRADPPPRHAVRRARPGRCRDRAQRRVAGPAVVAAGRAAETTTRLTGRRWRRLAAASGDAELRTSVE